MVKPNAKTKRVPDEIFQNESKTSSIPIQPKNILFLNHKGVGIYSSRKVAYLFGDLVLLSFIKSSYRHQKKTRGKNYYLKCSRTLIKFIFDEKQAKEG